MLFAFPLIGFAAVVGALIVERRREEGRFRFKASDIGAGAVAAVAFLCLGYPLSP